MITTLDPTRRNGLALVFAAYVAGYGTTWFVIR
jgi:hypothetical protein